MRKSSKKLTADDTHGTDIICFYAVLLTGLFYLQKEHTIQWHVQVAHTHDCMSDLKHNSRVLPQIPIARKFAFTFAKTEKKICVFKWKRICVDKALVWHLISDVISDVQRTGPSHLLHLHLPGFSLLPSSWLTIC